MSRQCKGGKYNSVLESIRDAITKGGIPEGGPLPGEHSLCSEHGCSRVTVRKALRVLEDQNFIRKVHGVGSFVVPKAERGKMPRRTARLCLLVPERSLTAAALDPFDQGILAGLDRHARANGCVVEVAGFSGAPESLLSGHANFEVDGYVWCRATKEAIAKARWLAGKRVPQVLIERELEGVPSVFFDVARAMDEMVGFLAMLGHRRIAFLDVRPDNPAISRRQEEYRKACLGHGCEDALLFADGDAGLALGKSPRFTALIHHARHEGAVAEALGGAGLKVPADVSLIKMSFSDFEAGEQSTRIQAPLAAMGEEAGRLLASVNLAPRSECPSPVFVPGCLVAGRTAALEKSLRRRAARG